jgi:cellobiose phosphorylase
MKYGNFSKDGLEYIIKTPNTPRPWINYLTNPDYCCIISQCAGGYSFYKDCRSDRTTRWAPQNYHKDRPGKYVYIKDNKTKKFWSATYQPVKRKPSLFETRHGLGYTIIKTRHYGIESEITYFVPTEDTCEIWLVKLKNRTSRKRDLIVVPYVEWLMGDYHMELRYRNIMNLYNRFWHDSNNDIIFARKTAMWEALNIQPFHSIAFFASSLPLHGCATRKDLFLGRYNSEGNPQSLTSDVFTSSKFCSGEDGIGAFKHRIRLKKKETKEFVVILGQAENKSTAKTTVSKYRNLKNAKSEFENVKMLWRKRILDNIVVKTPDKNFDLMINIWAKYQMYICNLWSRSPSYYHEGSGGRGYRDSCQDAEGLAAIDPKHVLSKIRTIASLIRRDGSCAGGWSTTRGAIAHMPNKDHPVWLVSTVSAHIKETGNKKILFEVFPYIKDGWIEKATKRDMHWKKGAVKDGEGTLFEHLEKNLNFTFTDVGKRGLPLIGHADWNDGIDAAGKELKGESVWLAMALVRSYKLLSELADFVGHKNKAQSFRDRASLMAQRINEYCWDGNWYLRGFTDFDTVYGSAKNKEGKIFANTQSWAVMSGIASKERQKKLFKAVDKYLDGKHGTPLFYPAYSNYNPTLGRITMFSEGTKENAAVFCHAGTFKIVADCMAGRGNKAYESIKKIMPNSQNEMDIYKTEPYVYAEYLIGPEHPYNYGEGAFTWITGTAAWTFLAATEYLLGVHREFTGLLINPAIPSRWKRYTATRLFRGDVYKIIVKNPKGVQSGVKRIKVDGIEQKHNIVRPRKDKKTHIVEVLMG